MCAQPEEPPRQPRHPRGTWCRRATGWTPAGQEPGSSSGNPPAGNRDVRGRTQDTSTLPWTGCGNPPHGSGSAPPGSWSDCGSASGPVPGHDEAPGRGLGSRPRAGGPTECRQSWLRPEPDSAWNLGPDTGRRHPGAVALEQASEPPVEPRGAEHTGPIPRGKAEALSWRLDTLDRRRTAAGSRLVCGW